MLEINTTVPSIVRRNHNSTNRIFTASLEMKNFSQVAFVAFSGNIELKKRSIIIVTGKYALSIKSENGNISIQTDINMTCNEESLHSTCLGGFTQSQKETNGIYKGEGVIFFSFLFTIFFASICLNFALNSLNVNFYSQFKYLRI